MSERWGRGPWPPGGAGRALRPSSRLRCGTRLAKIVGTILPGLPARSAKALIAAIEVLEGRLQDLRLPLLVVHGGEDVITSIEGSRALVAQATIADKRLIIYEGQRHDLAHEPDAEKVIGDIVAWVEAHVPPSAAP
ncbi:MULTISPECIES: serine aminopeptidase domain-containing protein [Myxococcus]|uniref:serine aminopeptidase domain-containing protein n=1 Tax=Myxococcus TaxID=32 RepID=UPI00137571B9|nr:MULTISPECIES: alpha/beta hydrolase [Myxococcus]WAM24474.1 alpha/beta hydrolase [Myxococcus sp. NMCA1]